MNEKNRHQSASISKNERKKNISHMPQTSIETLLINKGICDTTGGQTLADPSLGTVTPLINTVNSNA